MKKKCVLVGYFSILVFSLSACGAVLPAESVEAKEPEIIIIKDEIAVAKTEKPDTENGSETQETEEVAVAEESVKDDILLSTESTMEEAYVVMPSSNVEEETADAQVDESDFVAEIRGAKVVLGSEINGLMNTLGTPDVFEEEPNSRRDGSNKTYQYNGIVIYTKPANNRDVVKLIEYLGEEKTSSGIGIGSTRADIEAAYGIEYEMDPNYITYTYCENETISFQMDGEKCIRIELSWK